MVSNSAMIVAKKEQRKSSNKQSYVKLVCNDFWAILK